MRGSMVSPHPRRLCWILSSASCWKCALFSHQSVLLSAFILHNLLID